MNNNELRPFWARYFNFDLKFGLVLLVLVCTVPFLLVLKANQTGNYGPIGAVMFISAIIPFIFLSKKGRKKIGISSSTKIGTLTLSLLIGISFSFLLFLIGIQSFVIQDLT